MKKLWYAIKSIVYMYTIQYIVCIGAILLYLIFSNKGDILEYDIIYKYLIIGITITIIPMITYILRKYQQKEKKINIKKLLLTVPLGFGISWFYNMLTINFQESTELMNLHIIVIILYTVILGPIFEELLFRYVALRKAEEVYSKKTALIIISCVFALLHSGIIGVLYAFLIGLILGRVYQKEKNILYPIAIHISANLASIFVTGYNTWFLLVSIILLVLVIWCQKKLTN